MMKNELQRKIETINKQKRPLSNIWKLYEEGGASIFDQFAPI